MAIGNVVTWPGLSTATGMEFSRVGRGLGIARPNVFAQRGERYYHVQDYATTGVNSITFFNDKANDHVCNLSQGEVPNERPFWLEGICITFQDLTAAGARSGKLIDTAAITGASRAEEVRTILQAGLLKLYVGDRPVFEAQDLTHFPSDGGYYVPAAGLTFAAATASSIAPGTNGMPISGNRFKFDKPWPVLPGKKVKIDLLWQQLLTITTAGRIKVELVGNSVVPLNA